MAPRLLIVEGRFYPEIADELLSHATAAAEEAGVKPEVLTVPGALEIPAAIRFAKESADGFVALGCVLRGETYHFEIVSNESARGLMELSIKKSLCIGNGILTCETWDQAMVRANGKQEDKGGDAMRACLAMIALKERLARKSR